MSIRLTDPLLTAARGLILFLQAVVTLVIGALIVAIPIVVFARDRIVVELDDPTVALPLPAIVALLLTVLAMVVMLWLFLRNLRRIVDTVADGDPFVPANADRLTQMAWLMLGVQAITLPIMVLGAHIATVLKEPAGSTDFEIDFTGLVLVVTLFILARVFRQGAAMRDDLKGTV